MSDLRFEAGCNLQGKKRKKKNTSGASRETSGPYTIQKSGPPPSFGATAGQNDSTSIIFQSLYNLFGEDNPGVELSTFICNNKPDRAKMRPDCVSACIDHVTYTERQMDEQTGETTE